MDNEQIMSTQVTEDNSPHHVSALKMLPNLFISVNLIGQK